MNASSASVLAKPVVPQQQPSPRWRRGIATLVAAPALLLPASAAPQTTFIGEPTISKRPVDVEVTPNGLIAAVRGHAPSTNGTHGLAFIDTTTGAILPLQGSCQESAGQGGYYTNFQYQPSDFLRVTNSRAILIGGRDTNNDTVEDRTFIDVLAFDMSVAPPTVTCLAHHEEGHPTSASTRAGWVNDVEITPDESLAIVNGTNWIHVIDLSTGAIVEAFNIGSAPWAGPAFAGDSVDSIATTNSTAVVTTTRNGPSSPPNTFTRAWVYLIDLGSTPPEIVLEHELAGPLPIEPRDFWPHDVAITPNGSMAVVTANNAVAVYDLDQYAFLARRVAPVGSSQARRRFFSDIVDSVGTTDTRFVATATDYWVHSSPPCNQLPYTSRMWVAEVYELPPPPNPEMTMVPLRTYDLRSLTDFNGCNYTYQGPFKTDTPHDLELDAQKNMAVFRSERFNVVLTDLATPDAQDIVLDFRGFGIANNTSGTQTFVSDSVLIAPPFIQHVPVLPGQESGLHHYALTLGSSKKVGSLPVEVTVDVIDLNLSPPARVHSFTVGQPNDFYYLYPADFHLGPGAREFVLRCNAGPDESGVAGGRDFVRFNYGTLTEIARLGAQGRVWAVDSMEVGRFHAVSVGEQVSPIVQGFVHVVRTN